MVSVHRRNSRSALVANDEFWHSPILDMADALDDVSTSSSSSSELSLPPAHHQLLCCEVDQPPSYESLTGYDHKSSYDSDCSEDETQPSACCRQKVSAVKQQGGGSWLLGTFARLANDKFEDEESDDEDQCPPGLVRVPSGGSLESDDSSHDGEESVSDASLSKPAQRPKGVSFATAVKVQPIPHSSTLSPAQRRKMYATSFEVRQNKIRNKKEYRYDGYDWRNVTEEWEMGVDMVTGELVHPAHEQH